MSKLTGLEMQGASDFKLLDRKVVKEVIAMPERNRFFRGLVNWTGYKTKRILFDVETRIGGQTKWSNLSLFRLSISAITSFSNIALHLVTIMGIFTLVFSVGLAIQTLYNKMSGNAVSGFATVIILVLLLNSVIMISLGIIGIYISNIYIETKRRPIYIVAEEVSLKKEN
jgi:dolichol-phosphate mannosyltransferase